MSSQTQLGILLHTDVFCSFIETEPPFVIPSIRKPNGFAKYEVLSYFFLCEKNFPPGECRAGKQRRRRLPEGGTQPSLFWQKRAKMVATSARLAVPSGATVVSERPVIRPVPTAHCMASSE